VLLLGSTGFFGRAVAHKMLDAGHQVRMMVRDPMKAAAYKVRGAQVVVGDVLNAQALATAAQGTEHIVDLVAVRRNKPQSMFEVNADGPRLVGQAAKAAGTQSVIFVSAIGARLDQKYKYLTSRWMGEQELAKTGVAGTVLRFSFVLAEDGGVLTDFERAANFGPFLIIPGDGKTQIQPILREDAARCVVEAIGKAELLGKIIELGGPEVVTYETMFNWFVQARGIKKPRLHVLPDLLKPGAAVMEMLMDDPIATPDEINTIQLANIADGLDSVTVHFGWRPSPPSQWAPAAWRLKQQQPLKKRR
jgi:NADH dehydrogenase